MLYVGATPWHELGTKLDAPPTAAEAIVAAGLDWEVGLRDLRTSPDLENGYAGGEAVSHRATFRKSDGRILGVVGPGYHPIQNGTAFDWFNPFLETGMAAIETAGSLRHGQRVWILAKLNRAPSVIVPGDEVQKYVLLANSHDGTLASRVGFTPVRVVCANTLSMAVDDAASKLIRVRHTKNAKDVLEKVRDIMNLADASFEATADQYRALARAQVHPGDLEKYVRMVFTAPKTEQEKAKAALSPTASMLAEVLDDADKKNGRVFEKVSELFETGNGNQLPGVRGTYWAAYNAVTEYTTHFRGKDKESRLNALFADAAVINRKALRSALELVQA
jgi:phage/plasmid-like protein (TIGR03299 family)